MKMTQDTSLAKKQDMSKNPFLLSGETLTLPLFFDLVLSFIFCWIVESAIYILPLSDTQKQEVIHKASTELSKGQLLVNQVKLKIRNKDYCTE